MIMRLQNKSLTARQFERDYAGVPNCELVRGEVVRLSPGGMGHGRPSMHAAYLLEKWAREGKHGRVFTNETGIITSRSPDSVRGADAAYFSYRRLPTKKTPRGFSAIPPELVVEVVGRGQGWKEMVEKAAEYLAMGVDRVWVLDPDKRTLHVFKGDAAPQRLTPKELVRDSTILPGFSCRVARFFED